MGQSMPEPPAMLQAFAGTDKTGALMSEVSRGLQQHINDGIQRSMQRRESLATQFDQLGADPRYSARSDIVTQARRYAAMLRTIPPGQKLPKEFLTDKKTGGVPAYDQLVLQAHRSAPAEAPVALPEPPSTSPADFDAMFTAGGAAPQGPAAAAAPAPAPSAGGIPGGQPRGPNAISPSPVQPQQASAMPEPPPSILPDGMEPTAMGPLDVARQTADASRITNAIDVPGMGTVDARSAGLLKAQQTTITAMRKLGLAPDGTAIPPEQMSGMERAKIEHMKAQDELFDARIDLAKAQATGIPQNIEIARQRAGVAQQNADTLARKVGIDAQLLGLSGGAGGAGGAGEAGGADAGGGGGDAIQTMTDQLLNNQLSITDIPARLRPSVSLRVARQRGTIVPKPMREKINQFNSATGAMDLVYSRLEEYKQAHGVKDTAIALGNLSAAVTGVTRIIGRAAGEKGVFTTQDANDFRQLITPGMLLTAIDPQIFISRAAGVERLFEDVQKRELEGFYNQISRAGTSGSGKDNMPAPPAKVGPPVTSGKIITSTDELRRAIAAGGH